MRNLRQERRDEAVAVLHPSIELGFEQVEGINVGGNARFLPRRAVIIISDCRTRIHLGAKTERVEEGSIGDARRAQWREDGGLVAGGIQAAEKIARGIPGGRIEGVAGIVNRIPGTEHREESGARDGKGGVVARADEGILLEAVEVRELLEICANGKVLLRRRLQNKKEDVGARFLAEGPGVYFGRWNMAKLAIARNQVRTRKIR